MIKLFMMLILFIYSESFVYHKPNKFFTPLIKPASFTRQPHYSSTCLLISYLDEIGNQSSFPNIPYLRPKPKPNAIPILTFDQLFLVLFSITKIHISANSDRIIAEYDNKKGVHYISSDNEQEKIEFLISLINVPIEIVNDYPSAMDYINGSLYCTPKYSSNKNISSEDMEDIFNSTIHCVEIDEEHRESDDYNDYDIGL